MFRRRRSGYPESNPWAELGLLVLAVWALFNSAGSRAEELMSVGEAQNGRLLIATEVPGRYRPAPTVDTEVKITVNALIARVRLSQRFRNPGDDWVEGIYVFPLPEDAAVDHLRMMVGERTIEGLVKERVQARKDYQQAKQQGRKASLVEQERPNIFTSSVANIGPGETVLVSIEYQQALRLDNGQLRLRFPMVVAPRYIPGTAPNSDESLVTTGGSGWAYATDQVPDAPRITPPVPPKPPAGAVTLQLSLDAGFPLGSLASSYHSAQIRRIDGDRALVNLGPVQPDRDFELVWSPAVGTEPRAAWFIQPGEQDSYGLLMLTPPQRQAAQPLPRDVMFVLDTSGSMAGASIEQARAALAMAIRRLGAADRFNVIEFNSTARALYPSMRSADAVHKHQAAGWVDGLQANGGTEMARALLLALRGSGSGERLRQVVFLTDGAVGNEEALFDIIRQDLGNSRLFTIGIGSAPNSHFMTRAARFGRGTFTYIGSGTEVASKMSALFAKLEAPVLSHVQVQWPAGVQVEAYPQRIPDLYAGEPLLLAVRLKHPQGQMVVSGERDGQSWRVHLPLAAGRSAAGLDVLWARHRIADLMDALHEGADRASIRSKVVDTALAHHLVSAYTSLVAVDTTPSRPAEAPLNSAAVPVAMPAGMQHSKVFGGYPQTATAGPLWLLFGGLSVALGLLRRRHGARA